jgi:MinD-like ATPase involved in chromosome partitioning or flagellar assembly
VSSALDDGSPVVTRAPRSKVSRNFAKLAETVCDTFGSNSEIEDVHAIAS